MTTDSERAEYDILRRDGKASPFFSPWFWDYSEGEDLYTSKKDHQEYVRGKDVRRAAELHKKIYGDEDD